jgi:hypothetical protein
MRITKLTTDELNKFNRNLIDNYGYYEGFPKFKLVWSDDVVEKRLTKFTKDGFELLVPEVKELPKYRQWKPERYIIEMLTFIGDNPELSVNGELGYEPFYTFENKAEEFLIPNWNAAKVIIDAMLEIAGVRKAAKYNTSNDFEREQLIKRVDELEEALYGNESRIGDALKSDSAVGYGTRLKDGSFNPDVKIQEANKKFGEN